MSAMLALGCPSLDPFACAQDDQCTLEALGVCHPQGLCSYPDPECDSGRRYSRNAGAFAEQCVEPEQGSTTVASTGGASDESSTSSVDSSSGGPQPVCGNGIVEGDEQCDDPEGIRGEHEHCNDCTDDCQRVVVTTWDTPQVRDDRLSFFDSLVIDGRGHPVAVGRTGLGDNQPTYDRLVVRYDPVTRAVLDQYDEPLGGRDDFNSVLLGPDGEVLAIGLWDVDPDDGLTNSSQYRLIVDEYEGGQLDNRFAYDMSSFGQAAVLLGDRLVVVGMINDGVGPGFDHWDRLVLDDVLGTPDPLGIRGMQALDGERDLIFAVEAVGEELLVSGNVTINSVDSSQRWLARFNAGGMMVEELIDGGAGTGQEELFDFGVRGRDVFVAGSEVYNDGNNERPYVARIGLDGFTPIEPGRLLEFPGFDDVVPSQAGALTFDADGGVLVTINTTSVPDGEQGTTAVAKLDTESLDCLWMVQDPGFGRLGDVLVTPEGTIFVVGSSDPDSARGDAVLATIAVGG